MRRARRPLEVTMADMPLYQSHKKVRALEILRIIDTGNDLILHFVEPGHPHKKIDRSIVARYIPKGGDFYVVYDDGYESISPRQPFLDGYTLLPNPPGQPEFKEVKP